jgi:hypothetical protein
METLGKIFGGIGKVKIMRLFLFNPGVAYDSGDVATRSAVKDDEAGKELRQLEHAGFLRRRPFFKEVSDGKHGKVLRAKAVGWILEEKFPYLTELSNLLVHTVLFTESDLVKRLSRAGTLKFVAVSGVFIHDLESRIDLLVVGDRLKERVIENVVRSLEAEIGKELRFSVLETEDFKYRYGVFDKLVRDVLDYPHRTILDRVGIKER